MATITALLDCSHKSPGDADWTVHVEQVDVEVADGPCGHGETICRDCAPSWAQDYVFLEPFPWA